MEVRRRERLESTSLTTTPVTDDNLVDYHQHHLREGADPFRLHYNLYAVVVSTLRLHPEAQKFLGSFAGFVELFLVDKGLVECCQWYHLAFQN